MGYRFATRDETGEVEARARAHAAEDLLRRSIESIPEGFAIYDPEDRLVPHAPSRGHPPRQSRRGSRSGSP